MVKRSLNWVLGAAVAGVVAGHQLTYAVVAPHDGERSGLLALTGHSYWRLAVLAGLAFGIASLGVVTVRHFRAGLRGTPAVMQAYLGLALRLAALQMGIFTALEVAERLGAGQPLSSLVYGGLLPAGLAIQLLIALAAAGLLHWLARTAEVAGTACRPFFAPAPSAGFPVPRVLSLGSGRICDTCRGRAPPLVLLLSH